VTSATPDVLAFYRELPFNYRASARDHARQIRAINAIEAYPILTPLLKKSTTVLDVGCGAGWFSLSASHHYGCEVTGIDFNEVAIIRAREVGAALGTSARFEVADLFTYEPGKLHDLVASVGVLHHTKDCHAALIRLCTEFTRPGGHVFVGLYHADGRRPFLEHFRAMKLRGCSDEDMLKRYRQLHANLGDETHLRSWFRDQVLHPHETQHTLRELIPLLERTGMALVASSINGFQPIRDLREVLGRETDLERIGEERLRENKYYPGFFVILARKQ
jgi:SAM-dependent methyltransferase